jgi:hypothetical protein
MARTAAIGTKGTTGVEAGGRRLKLYLFSHIQSVIHLNPEISDSAFQLGMAEEKLDCTQVTGLAINLGSLRTPHRVRAIKGRLQANAFNPAMHQPGILASGYVRTCMKSTWEKISRTGSPEHW